MILFGRHFVNVSGQRLNSYTKSSGGGMQGGYSKMSIRRLDGTYALYTAESAEWNFQDPQVREYLVEAALLDDIQKVLSENKMNFWNRKKLTDMFVADGPSCPYRFEFDSKTVSFSSQHYPEPYASKLARP